MNKPLLTFLVVMFSGFLGNSGLVLAEDSVNNSNNKPISVSLPELTSTPPVQTSSAPQTEPQEKDNSSPTSEGDVETDNSQGRISIEAENPQTGETVNIDLNSNELTYDNETQTYIATGDVYIIIPEKSIEILADKAIFDSKTSNMVAVGNVFIISEGKVLGSKKARFDLETDFSTYVEPRTVTKNYRLQAMDGQRSKEYVIMHNGRFIMDSETLTRFSNSYRKRGLRLGTAAAFAYYSAYRSAQLLGSDFGRLLGDTDYEETSSMDGTVLLPEVQSPDEATVITGKSISPRDVASADFNPKDDQYRIITKKIDIYRKKGGILASLANADKIPFDEITLKHSRLKYLNMPIFYTPIMEFGYQEENRFITYLGPEMGHNVDYGGFYFGPGWDFRLLDGWVRYSPIISYGGGRRLKASSDEPRLIEPQMGYGFLGHFRSYNNSTDFAYGTTLREPIFMTEQRLFNSNETRLRVAVNQIYRNGFFGVERPNVIAEITDLSQFRLSSRLLLKTFITAGVARDEFFPTRQRRSYVRPKSNEPITTPRVQIQGELRTMQPLLYFGKFGALGAVARSKLSLYGTGDKYFIIQGGPFLNAIAGPLFSQVRYFYSQSIGESPFVFDTYYSGRNSLQTVNSVDIGKHLTVGAFNVLNLNRDNARKDLVINQKLFVSTGSKNVRFSVAYDTIQKRSFFGITINPEGGQLIMDFDTMNLYQPGYDPKSQPIVQPSPTSQN